MILEIKVPSPGESITEVDKILNKIIINTKKKLNHYILPLDSDNRLNKSNLNIGFNFSNDYKINSLSTIFIDYVENKWALYPDHVVFLGPTPKIVDSISEAKKLFLQKKLSNVPFIFVRGMGTLENKSNP